MQRDVFKRSVVLWVDAAGSGVVSAAVLLPALPGRRVAARNSPVLSQNASTV
jgi:hypothetical protein